MTAPTGLYIHWPYCTKICPYCDFNVVRHRDVDVDAWTRALQGDVERWADLLGRRQIVSVYLGGGTPSLMPPSLVEAVLAAVQTQFELVPGAEVTLEANPTDLETGRLASFAAAGVNRLSLGVQSFDDQHLTFLGRNHNGRQARLAVDSASALFGKVTFDLIYALPGEGAESWADRLTAAMALGVDHLSLYQLTVEPGTAFAHAVARGDWQPVDEDQAADLYTLTQEVTGKAGFAAYEVSNHARPGAAAVHNALYWQGADWIGLGPGAHGRVTREGQRIATVGERGVAPYLTQDFDQRYAFEPLSAHDVAVERLAGGLRPVDGLAMADLAAPAQLAIAPVRTQLIEEGMLTPQPGQLVVSPTARLLTDYVVGRLVQAL